MFRASVLLSFTALALALAPGDVKVSVNAVSSSVRSIDDMVLTAVVSNPSSKDVRVFTFNNILDDQPTRSFSVTKDGKEVAFTGIYATPDLSNEANWVTIPAGQAVSVNHTVSNLYNFEPHGAGTYIFSPYAFFQSDASEPPLVVDVESVNVEVERDGDVSFRYLVPPSASFSTVTCTDTQRAQILNNSREDAKFLANNTLADIRIHPNSESWNKFFGGANKDEVVRRFTLIAEDFGTRNIHCNEDPAAACNRAAAYVLFDYDRAGNIIGSDIYTCDVFYRFSDTPDICRMQINDINASRGGIMLHELSHATVRTRDIAYYCQNVQRLSPEQKLNNADSYQCMALNIYRLSNC
ncbi:hypothetical protein AAF712_010669 [Marasmius tenuissimus]|uniref:Lysine-specific metallo-endopeptidase domain-containing protein n=1 Tax=Marasmius tenuissimus TaxID=585030 RepID=A0ABR2ZPZ0_9AGAR